MIRTMYEVQVAGGAAVARKSFTVVTICECNNGPAGPCGGPPMNHPLKHPSPPLLLVAALHLALFVAGLAVSPALAGGAVFPSPFDPNRADEYFLAHADA